MMPIREAFAVVRVFAKAAIQHRNLNGWKTRNKCYWGALDRHQDLAQRGHVRDEKSGEHPLAHVAANALILMWRQRNGR